MYCGSVIQKTSGGHWGRFLVAHADGPAKKGAALDLFLMNKEKLAGTVELMAGLAADGRDDGV